MSSVTDPEGAKLAADASESGARKKKQRKKSKNKAKDAKPEEKASDGWAIKGVDLTVQQGQLVCIVGVYSRGRPIMLLGCGKVPMHASGAVLTLRNVFR